MAERVLVGIMANNYLQFSFAIALNNEGEREWVESLLSTASVADELWDLEENISEFDKERMDLFREVFPEFPDTCSLDFDFKINGNNELWIYAEDGMGNPALAADFIQHYLKVFDPKAHVSFEFAETCSKPRIDEFGGGAVIITAENQYWMSTGSWIQDKLEELKKMGHV